MTQAQPRTLERETAFMEAVSRLERGHLAALRRGANLELDQRPYFLERLLFAHLPNWQFWARNAAYLVASLYALVERPSTDDAADRESETAPPSEPRQRRASLGRDLGQLFRAQDERPSTEKRFLSLLDADEAQFAYHLRQAVTLLNALDIQPHWPQLLHDARAWGHPDTRDAVRDRWAQDFYRQKPSPDPSATPELTPEDAP